MFYTVEEQIIMLAIFSKGKCEILYTILNSYNNYFIYNLKFVNLRLNGMQRVKYFDQK